MASHTPFENNTFVTTVAAKISSANADDGPSPHAFTPVKSPAGDSVLAEKTASAMNFSGSHMAGIMDSCNESSLVGGIGDICDDSSLAGQEDTWTDAVFSTEVELPSTINLPRVVGPRGNWPERVAVETGTVIEVPPRPSTGNTIVICGDMEANVNEARARIEYLVLSSELQGKPMAGTPDWHQRNSARVTPERTPQGGYVPGSDMKLSPHSMAVAKFAAARHHIPLETAMKLLAACFGRSSESELTVRVKEFLLRGQPDEAAARLEDGRSPVRFSFSFSSSSAFLLTLARHIGHLEIYTARWAFVVWHA
jgi:hypothetical protein